MIAKWEKMATGSNFGRRALISDIEIRGSVSLRETDLQTCLSVNLLDEF